ncbi:hypothetical protein Tco_0595813 [Tanacetum coccineum]
MSRDIVQAAKLRKITDIREGGEEFVLSTHEYIKKVVEDVGEDEDFMRGPWVSAVEFVKVNWGGGGGHVGGYLGNIKNYLKNGKLHQVVAIIKSCTPNALDDLTVTLKTFQCLDEYHQSFSERGECLDEYHQSLSEKGECLDELVSYYDFCK